MDAAMGQVDFHIGGLFNNTSPYWGVGVGGSDL